MKIAVRLDDITPDMNWKRFYEFKALLDQYQVKPLIGVVPDNRDENLHKQGPERDPELYWNTIRALKEEGWVIAMHGFNHLYASKKGGIFPLNNFSEFAGRSYETQRAILEKGRDILKEHEIYTDIFMAPAHTYDNNTLRALKETGFSKITDGFGSAPYRWKGILFYPVSFRLKDSMKKKEGYTTMVVHTNTITEEDMKRYRGYFENPGETEWISYKEYLECRAEERKIPGRLREYFMALAKFILVKLG